jgi:hypothetical protein
MRPTYRRVYFTFWTYSDTLDVDVLHHLINEAFVKLGELDPQSVASFNISSSVAKIWSVKLLEESFVTIWWLSHDRLPRIIIVNRWCFRLLRLLSGGCLWFFYLFGLLFSLLNILIFRLLRLLSGGWLWFFYLFGLLFSLLNILILIGVILNSLFAVLKWLERESIFNKQGLWEVELEPRPFFLFKDGYQMKEEVCPVVRDFQENVWPKSKFMNMMEVYSYLSKEWIARIWWSSCESTTVSIDLRGRCSSNLWVSALKMFRELSK